ncbi:MAG TPA: hypothetical protein VL120_18605 [Solirubrobacteraceae bacterium]|nr:hypothetical protein [Solirubrobacteraceae bacterium]
MHLLAAWVLYPVALGVVCLGLGLLIARVAGWAMPGILLLPAGCAALLAYARVVAANPTSAKLALPLLLVLTVAGLGLSLQRLRTLRPDPLVAAAAGALFVAFGLPILMSGTPTFAGYLALPDTSHQLSLAWLLAHHGPDASVLQPGSLQSSMTSYIASRYPIGGQAALGITAPLGVLDLAWLYQPFLSFLVVVAALALGSLAAPLLRRPWQTALVVFAAGQPALVYGFAMQGSIKELAAMAMIVVLVALLAAAIAEDRPARSLLPIAAAAAAALGALGPAVIPYLGIPGLAVIGYWGARLVRRRERADMLWLGLGAAAAVVVALPVLRTLGTAITVTKATLVTDTELGNLAHPLALVQVLGPWLTGDYRYDPTNNLISHDALLWLFGLAAAGGLAWALAKRAWGPLLLAATLGLASLFLLDRGGPYADAKVLMILSPVVPLLALIAAASLWHGRLRIVSAGICAALVAGLLWSSALAYHDVSLAPYDRYSELLQINDRYADKGPATLDEYDEFGKYFLRDPPGLTAPEQVTRYRHGPYHPNALIDPKRRPTVKTPINMDDVTLEYAESVPYIILRRSPTLSRPPANFVLDRRGTYYEVWRRTGRESQILAHKPLGPDVFHPAEPVTRAVARAFAARARRLGGRIAYVPRARIRAIQPADLRHPDTWVPFGGYPGALVPAGPGGVTARASVTAAGRYRLWIEGSFARRMTVRVDGRRVGRTPEELNNPGEYVSFGPLTLAPGAHRIAIHQGGGDLRPGSGGYLSSLRHVGAIVLSPLSEETLTVKTVAPAGWRRLVGVNADWLEIVRRS